MKITEVSASFSGVIATGSYQNIKPSYSMSVELDSEDNAQKVFKSMRDMLRNIFKEEEQQAIVERIQKEREDLRFLPSPKTGKLLPSVTSIINYDADFFVSPQDLTQYCSQGNCIDARVKHFVKTGEWVAAKDIKDLWTDIVILTKGSLKLPLDVGDFPGFIEKYPINALEVGERFFNDELGFTGETDLMGIPNKIKDALDIPTVFDVKRTPSKISNGLQLSAYCRNYGFKQGIIIPLSDKTGQGFSKPVIYNEESLNGYFKMFQAKQKAFKKRYGI